MKKNLGMSTPQPKGNNNKEKIKMQLILWEAYGIF